MQKLEYHPVANIFPMMRDDEFDALKRDISENGQLEPIWLHDGQIIDGRNRYLACIELGIEPHFRTWSGEGSLVSFVMSLNLHRRHLSSSQKAVVALEILPMLESEAWERRTTGVNQHSSPVEIIPPPSGSGKSREIAAEIVQTNPRYVSDAKKIKAEAPEFIPRIMSGEMTIPQVKREIVFRERKEAPELPSEKYRIIYADPPWKYGNNGLEDYGHAERHYPTMSISELCQLPIEKLSDANSVLFLWVTSPLLAESFDVIKAWGFKYKTSFVWDKIKHNFGHYNSVRHEFLLICTKGSCTPDQRKLFDSVQSIERTEKHSQKPQEFRNIIDEIYTKGKRIELFARENFAGWDSWGNEPNDNK